MKQEKNILHFEESIIDDLVDSFNQLEQPLTKNVFIFCGIAALIFFIITLSRLFFLISIKGDFYQARGLANINRLVISASPRGVISDRFEKTLVKNTPSFSAVIYINTFLKNEKKEEIISQIGEILKMPAEKIAKEINETNWEKQNRLILSRNIGLEQAIALKTKNIPGLGVEDDYARQYPDGPTFSHLIGYTGFGKADNDIIGVSGLEAYYDTVLKGQDGEYVILRDVQENEIERKILKEAKPGHQLITTIDGEFQKYFYNRLHSGLTELNRKSGIGLAIDPRNGEILALINLPSFDNNQPEAYLDEAGKPLFNRAISGLYSPGSTIKPLVALAALREGIVTPEWETYANGFLEIPNPYNPEKPSRFLDWRVHGTVNLYSALARSSNIYFYIIGGGWKNTRGLGINKLNDYWRLFGLNEATGIDLDGEKASFLPDPAEKEKRTNQQWRIGDTYNVSIGQGDLTVTPLRLLTFFASIANDGKMYRPFLVKKILDDQNKIIRETLPEELLTYSDWSAEIKAVQQGLRDAVAQPYGTATKLYDLSYRTAGKTGSAQISNNTKTNAFFIGYGPFDKPQIAVLILVEDAKEGSVNTLPIAKDILNWYYQHRL